MKWNYDLVHSAALKEMSNEHVASAVQSFQLRRPE